MLSEMKTIEPYPNTRPFCELGLCSYTNPTAVKPFLFKRWGRLGMEPSSETI